MKTFIAVTCFNGFVHNELAIRLLEWSHECCVIIKYYTHISPLDNARNKAVKDFLKTDCTHFLSIDNDVIPPKNALLNLLNDNKDVVAPACFTMKRDDYGYLFPMLCSFKFNKEKKGYIVHYGKGLEKVDIVTGGCHLVKRKVLKKILIPYEFEYKEGIVKKSEDFIFSEKCKKNGFKLYTNYSIICSHYKNIDVKSINELMIKYGR